MSVKEAWVKGNLDGVLVLGFLLTQDFDVTRNVEIINQTWVLRGGQEMRSLVSQQTLSNIYHNK